jgi:hypothetical protein
MRAPLRGDYRDEVPLRGDYRDEVPLRGDYRDEVPLRGLRSRLRRSSWEELNR